MWIKFVNDLPEEGGATIFNAKKIVSMSLTDSGLQLWMMGGIMLHAKGDVALDIFDLLGGLLSPDEYKTTSATYLSKDGGWPNMLDLGYYHNDVRETAEDREKRLSWDAAVKKAALV